jgi:hypothetical protein
VLYLDANNILLRVVKINVLNKWLGRPSEGRCTKESNTDTRGEVTGG